MRRKRCKTCGKLFQPRNTLQQTCSATCALAYARTKDGRESIERIRRKETRAQKQTMKPKAKLRQEAQQAFNAFIRERDKDQPCISCGRSANWDGQWHASHWKSTGANSALRFNEDNVHKACVVCNNYRSGNIGEYTPRLIDRIGEERVKALESTPRIRKWSREELTEIKKTYQQKLRELK